MANKQEVDTRKFHVVRVKGMTETVLQTYEDGTEAVDYMNYYGKKNHSGIIAVVKGDLTESGAVIHREQIGVYDAWLERLLKD